MGQSSRNFQPFLSYRNCKAIFFLFQKMFYRIHSLGSYERILLKAFQFVSIVYFTETEISSRKHQAGTMFVSRLKMTVAYQQLELDLNFSINILKNHTSLTELLTSSAFQKQCKSMVQLKCGKAKKGGKKVKIVFRGRKNNFAFFPH